MDAYEATQVVFARVQAMDPENVSKIIGFLLLQDRSEQEMGRLALASDALVQAAIARARRELGLHHHHHHQYHHHRPPLFVNTTDDFVGGGGGSAARFMRTQQPPPPPPPATALHQEHHLAWKPCLYYSRGYCKHGASCRFLHGNCSTLGDSSSSPSPTSPSPTSPSHHFVMDDDEAGGSLERLELELQELLRARRGVPISIASLPQLYYERFGKALQAQGYRTESQRHGKTSTTTAAAAAAAVAAVAGPSTTQSNLTKLLARLKGTVALIDRPHGQHAVVLAEEAHRFVGYRADRDDLKDASPSSRQIYLTFPAESTFSEEDVSNHFRAYGPVQDVRIPYQQKRMFGFVTFLYPETVKTILSEGNPHYICGSRVLVKPYREKAKLHERKLDPLRAAAATAAAAGPQIRDASFYDAFTRRLEEERMLDLERRRLMAAEKLVQAKLLLSSNEHQQESLLNGMPMPNTSAVTMTTSSMASTDVHGPPEPAMTSEDIRSNTPFGYVLDVLDNGDDETDPVPATSSTTTASPDSSSSCEVHKSTNGAHFLPECPFAASADEEGQEEHQQQQQLKDKLMGMDLSDIFSPRRVSSPRLFSPRAAALQQGVICCICYKHCIEPSKLNCSHTFCVQCILKVIRGSKDECPICRQHIGSQVYKILQNRDLQSWLSTPNTTQLIQQQIW